jgi:hypothetical protein
MLQLEESLVVEDKKCFACGGPYHPASGHLFREFDVAYCGACYRPFLTWMKGHLNRRWSKGKFYEEAATSIRPPL